MVGTDVLSVRGLKKSYRKAFSRQQVRALKGIDFRIPAGTVTGFLGANGAGKTTTIKCILNMAFPDAGEIEYFGQKGLSPEIKKRIGFLPERPYFYEYLTGHEFLRFYGQLSLQISRAQLNERIDRLLKRVGLEHAKKRQLRSYSKGMLQRVGIAQALIHEPEFVILDEPMTGLDPDGRHEVSEIIKETARSGTAIFFSSHLLPDAERLCDNLVILKLGELIYQGALSGFIDKVETRYSVTYSADGTRQIIEAQDLHEVQRHIDKLREQRREIIEVKPQRPTLEEAFVRVAFDKRGVP